MSMKIETIADLKSEELASQERINKLFADCESDCKRLIAETNAALDKILAEYLLAVKEESDRLKTIQVAFHEDYLSQARSRAGVIQ